MPDPLERHPAPEGPGAVQGREARLKRRRAILRRSAFGLAALGAAGTVWWLSGRIYLDDAGTRPIPGGVVGNFAHFVAFAGLATLAASAFDRRGAFGGGSRCARLAAFWSASGYGLLDEIHQYFTPGRCCSVYDLLIDAAGAYAAITFPWRLWRKPGKRAWRFSVRSVIAAAAALAVAAATSKSRPWPDLALESGLGIILGRG